MAGKTKPYNEPRYGKSTDIHAISHHSKNSQRGSFSRYWDTYRSNNGSNRNNSHQNSHQAAGSNPPRQSSNKEPVCYYCEGLHYITKCAQYQQDKAKYEHTKQQIKQNYQNRLNLGTKKNNVSINGMYFKNQEDDNTGNYSKEQAVWSCTESGLMTSQQQQSLTPEQVSVSCPQGFFDGWCSYYYHCYFCKYPSTYWKNLFDYY